MKMEPDHETTVILDIESKKHLHNDCAGDFSRLQIGLAGIKYLREDKFEFFLEDNLRELNHVLENASRIIGFNLVGYNGLDYKMLQNYGIKTEPLLSKTYDIMTVLLRVFGSFKGLSLDNIVRKTFNIPKKKGKKANYKLIQSRKIEEVKINLKHELELIEKLFIRIAEGGVINFETRLGLVDEHELTFFNGFPTKIEEIVDPYDFPVGGMRLQIKDIINEVIKCKKCKTSWQIRSLCYYGDTISEKIHCPRCNNLLMEVRTNLLGEPISILEKHT
jgi:hypothetical protein